MSFAEKVREAVLGKPHDPFNPDTRKHIALIAFLAWIGLGADGLSSSCYGPEEAFRALGTHNSLFKLLSLVAITGTPRALRYDKVASLALRSHREGPL